MIPLPTEILILILSNLHRSQRNLFHCSLVDKAFNHAASQLLYTRVTYSPVFRAILDLRDKAELPQKSQLYSACLQRNAAYVQELVINGYLSTKSISLSTFSTTLASLVKRLPNLSSLELTPANYHDHVFVALFEALLPLQPGSQQATDSQELTSEINPTPDETPTARDATLPPLRSITVNHSCTDEKTAPLLIQLIQAVSPHLDHFTIQSPTRAALNILPDCLAGAKPGAEAGAEAEAETGDTVSGAAFPALRSLHFEDNCGSITPGVLSGLVAPAYIQSNLRELTLGLSYSLTHDDVFRALSQLERLEKLQLQYYFQLKPFTIRPRLIHLTTFTAVHELIRTSSQARAFCKWARTVIDYAPLESFKLVGDQDEEADDDDEASSSSDSEKSNASEDEDDDDEETPVGMSGPAFDSLIFHLVAKHTKTLRALDMRHAYVGVKAARQLILSCTNLRVLRIAVRLAIANSFCEISDKLVSLQQIGFEIRNRRPSKKSKLANEGLAKRVLEEGPGTLQVVWLDGVRFRKKAEDLIET